MTDNDKLGITVNEATKLLGIGRNLMLKLVTVPGFPVIRFKKKIIINKNKLQQWFDEILVHTEIINIKFFNIVFREKLL